MAKNNIKSRAKKGKSIGTQSEAQLQRPRDACEGLAGRYPHPFEVTLE